MRWQSDSPPRRGVHPFGPTRTELYDAEMRERARRASPPPEKPLKKPDEPGWKYLTSTAYKEWQRLSDDYCARHPEYDAPFDDSEPPSPGYGATQHGLPVNMSHACVLQVCTCRIESWRVQSGGADHCVFCVEPHVGCSRCPECEALACQTCLKKIAALEQESSILGLKFQYTALGDLGDEGDEGDGVPVQEETGQRGVILDGNIE